MPAAVQGALPVQLSFPPRHPRTANVICAPRTAGQVISLAEHRDPGRGCPVGTGSGGHGPVLV
ncbi:lantibiotic dehydratase [Actinomadura sp. NPDC047616]|uniref:lantibiotic dehydratase n=1 Tax=Actinomadura sp. NPDC047616 TaxID=3155914 RepID=UPI0034036A7A